MKPILKKALKYYLKYLTKLALSIHRPRIIVVSGSTNQFFAKEEISRVLSEKGIESRANPKNFNTEIGLPLSILNLSSGYGSYIDWVPAIKLAPVAVFRKMPKYLVLGIGISNPGDMDYLMSIVKPDIAVITDISQRYLEGFEGMDELANEYESLAKNIRRGGTLVFNMDNARARRVAENFSGRKISFSLNSKSDYQAVNIAKGDRGQSIDVFYGDKTEKFQLNRFGIHHVYSLLIGLIVGFQADGHL